MREPDELQTLFHLLDNEAIEIDKNKIEKQCNEIHNYFVKIYNNESNVSLINQQSIALYRTSFVELLEDYEINYPILPHFNDENADIVWTDYIKLIYTLLNAIINEVSAPDRSLIMHINKIVDALNKPMRLRLDRKPSK